MLEKLLYYKKYMIDLLDLMDNKYLLKIRKVYMLITICLLVLKLIF